MTSAQWYDRAEVWQARLERLSHTRLQPRLFTGVEHALQMAAINSRMEIGCGHSDSHLCDLCFEAIR